MPKALQNGLDACSKALGEATSHASGPAGHIGQGARAGVWDFWSFFKALPATLSLRCTALCAPRRLGVGDDMNVAGGNTFCLCFKESDVPFVNIQEKY